MSGYLVIVESPAKAKTIGRILGKKYKVEASVGHLRDLPVSKLAIDIEHDFKPQYMNIRGKGDLIKALKKDAKDADRIFLATDPDREGEAISWHLSKILDIDENAVCRVTFNEVTKNAVTEAFKEPRKINMELVDAYQARRVLDRLVGYSISPVLWKKVKKGLSAGRVQSVATRLVCDREEEIENFVPQEYWTITAELLKDTDTNKALKANRFTAKYFGENGKKHQLKTKEEADQVYQDVLGKDFIVASVKTTEKKKSPPPPFITSTLQQEASRKLGFTASKTMSVVQSLYEGVSVGSGGPTGLVTYIRTDSTRISDEAAAAAKEEILREFGETYLPARRRIYQNKNAAQDAHEAIRPAHIEYKPADIKEKLTSDQYKLYKLIYERFIASQMADAIYSVCTVEFDVSGHTFRAVGTTVKFAGYTKLYQETTDEKAEDADDKLPYLEQGERVIVEAIKPEQHFTQPPPRYTEATLVKALEENGIGLVAYSPLGRGFLTGKIDPNTTFGENDNRADLPRFTKEAMHANQVVLNYIQELAEAKHATSAQIALAWLLAQKPWIVPIPGTTKKARIQENIAAANITFTPEEMAKINEVLDHMTIVGDRYNEAEKKRTGN